MVGRDTAAEEVFPEPLAEGEGFVARFEKTLVPGFYQLESRDTASADAESFAVNVEPAEGDLTTVSEAEIRKMAPGFKCSFLSAESNLPLAIDTVRVGTELWWPLVMAVAMLALVETYCACRFTARGTEES